MVLLPDQPAHQKQFGNRNNSGFDFKDSHSCLSFAKLYGEFEKDRGLFTNPAREMFFKTGNNSQKPKITFWLCVMIHV